jgi:hypothetical protein
MALKCRPPVTIATAVVFCHRFFLRQSHARNDRMVSPTEIRTGLYMVVIRQHILNVPVNYILCMVGTYVSNRCSIIYVEDTQKGFAVTCRSLVIL